MTGPSDSDLMRLARSGRQEAFAEIVRRHQRALVNRFRRLGVDHHGAEDCAQDTFLRLYRCLRTYRPVAPFGAFLCRLARQAWIDWVRRQTRERAVSLGSAEGSFPAPAEGAVEERLDLRAALASMPEHWKEVVLLSIDEGLTYAEISEVLGIPAGTVKSRMFYAVRWLREALHARSVD